MCICVLLSVFVCIHVLCGESVYEGVGYLNKDAVRVAQAAYSRISKITTCTNYNVKFLEHSSKQIISNLGVYIYVYKEPHTFSKNIY